MFPLTIGGSFKYWKKDVTDPFIEQSFSTTEWIIETLKSTAGFVPRTNMYQELVDSIGRSLRFSQKLAHLFRTLSFAIPILDSSGIPYKPLYITILRFECKLLGIL